MKNEDWKMQEGSPNDPCLYFQLEKELLPISEMNFQIFLIERMRKAFHSQAS